MSTEAEEIRGIISRSGRDMLESQGPGPWHEAVRALSPSLGSSPPGDLPDERLFVRHAGPAFRGSGGVRHA